MSTVPDYPPGTLGYELAQVRDRMNPLVPGMGDAMERDMHDAQTALLVANFRATDDDDLADRIEGNG